MTLGLAVVAVGLFMAFVHRVNAHDTKAARAAAADHYSI